MPSGQKKQQWIAPVNDNTLVLEHARTQDLRDPRVLGKGPCQDKHKNPMKPEIDREVEGLKWGGNQYGRWADCQVCALRLLYYPKEAHVGKYASNEPAPVVEKALQMIKDNGYANKCTHKVVKTFLELAEAEMKLVKNSKKTNQRPEDKPDEDPKDKPDEDPKQKKKEDEAPKQARAAPCRRNFAQRPTAPRPASAASSSSGPVMVEPAHVRKRRRGRVGGCEGASGEDQRPQEAERGVAQEEGGGDPAARGFGCYPVKRIGAHLLQALLAFVLCINAATTEHFNQAKGVAREESAGHGDLRDDFWEVCCAPESTLTSAVEKVGMHARRINLRGGFDLMRHHSIEEVISLAKRTRPRRIWISVPCGPWSSVQNANQWNDEQRQQLMNKRKRSRRLIKNVRTMLVGILQHC